MNAIILLALAIGQPPPNVPAIPQAPPVREVKTYGEAFKQAVEEHSPLLCFVACPERPVKGHVTVRIDSLYGDPTPRIVLAECDGKGWMNYVSSYKVGTELPVTRKAVVPQLANHFRVASPDNCPT